jgi:hypothetical protein
VVRGSSSELETAPMHDQSATPNPLLALAVAAHNAASLAQEQCNWYAALFAAIKRDSAPFTEAYKLASVGTYLAGDLANTLDCDCADLDEHIKRLTGAKDQA